MENAIEVSKLTKYYGELLAVDHIDFEVKLGEFFGLLGPNGAGKTTTIRMLTGLSKPSSGTATVAGYDVVHDDISVKRHVGVVPETSNLYGDLSIWDNMMFMAELYHVPSRERAKRMRNLLELFGLYERRRDHVAVLSKGLKRRLTIAASIIHDPDVLFLDEPTMGLDVQSSRLIKKLVKKLSGEDKTIFLTTHHIEEADELCQRIAVINHGKVAAIGSPEVLKAQTVEGHVIEVSFDKFSKRLVESFRGEDYVSSVATLGDKLRLHVDDTSKAILRIADFAKKRELRVISIDTLRPRLEDAFVKLTGLTPIEAERLEQIRLKKGGKT